MKLMRFQKLVQLNSLVLLSLLVLAACGSAPEASTPTPLHTVQVLDTVEAYLYDELSATQEPLAQEKLYPCHSVIPALYHDDIAVDTVDYCHVCTTWGDEDNCDEGMMVYFFRNWGRLGRLYSDAIDNPACISYTRDIFQPVDLETSSLVDNAYECELNDGLTGFYFRSGGFYVELEARDDFPPRLVGEEIFTNINRLYHSEDCMKYGLGVCWTVGGD